jgi:fructose-specific phosphotransferase system IIA component|uniref:PTS sugar transporter subunit IIA n=1 Tax=candidate division WOR-3 bacterium TaxID=2052148 RepID=A0A7C3YUL0_UNCW3
MVKLVDLLEKGGIILNIKAKEKIGAIKEMAQVLIAKGLILNPEEFFAEILRRENLESTGIGMGVAIPHARTNAIKDLALVLGRSEEGVDFSSLDKKPSHLLFLISAPEDKKEDYIFTLAKISRLIRKDEVRIRLNKAKTEEELLAIIRDYE